MIFSARLAALATDSLSTLRAWLDEPVESEEGHTQCRFVWYDESDKLISYEQWADITIGTKLEGLLHIARRIYPGNIYWIEYR